MKKIKTLSTRFLSLSLIFVSLTMSTNPVFAATARQDNKNPVETSIENYEAKRLNLNYLEGAPGDTHLVYTYEQDGKTYKVVENSNESFTEVNSIIYILTSGGTYIEDSKETLSVNSDGEIVIKTKDFNNSKNEEYIWSFPDEKYSNISLSSSKLAFTTLSSNFDWITEVSDGSTRIKNTTISIIISSLTAIATKMAQTTGALPAYTVAAIGFMADKIFSYGSSIVYYHKVYNWRHSERSYLVIEDTEYTNFYLDSAHKYFLNYTYYEWLWK